MQSMPITVDLSSSHSLLYDILHRVVGVDHMTHVLDHLSDRTSSAVSAKITSLHRKCNYAHIRNSNMAVWMHCRFLLPGETSDTHVDSCSPQMLIENFVTLYWVSSDVVGGRADNNK